MKWSEKYATGNAEIDAQHKTLFESTEEFREALEGNCSSETFRGFLEFLRLYTEIHFCFEGECMLASHCPAAKQNQTEHEAFTEFVETEYAEFRKNGFDRARAATLLDTIDAWLDSHILRIDTQLRETNDNSAA
ncbi:bacteriohemerythrin [Shimia sp.]|uniref:bacteriohemerythrin n=1 Tax=Shimia sp. TaxID=1954381 RepID=UPI003568FE68